MANCKLSLQNYNRSVHAARILGVDPLVAHSIVEIASSSIASVMMPSLVRKVAVQTIMSGGLASLRLLRKSGGPTDFVVRRLKEYVSGNEVGSGKGLPLIFPAEDLLFSYTHGALIQPKNNKFDKESSTHHDHVSDVLKIGKRIPHCWLKVKGNSGVSVNDYFISTVSLPRLMQLSMGSGGTVTSLKTSIFPSLVLITSSSTESQEWVRTISQWLISSYGK